MYIRDPQGWSKHFDFIVLDELSLQIAFLLAVLIRQQAFAYAIPDYRILAFVYVVTDAIAVAINNSFHNVLSRGYLLEAFATVRHALFVFATAIIYLFATQTSDTYSRIAVVLTFGLHIILSYGFRLLWKPVTARTHRRKKHNMLVVTEPETAEELLRHLAEEDPLSYQIIGVVLTELSDKDSIAGYRIVSDLDGVADYMAREWIDAVYIDAPLTDERIIKLMDISTLMGITTHYHVPNLERNSFKRFSEKLGKTTVLTTSINYATPFQAVLKRLFDLAAGLVGSVIALLIIAIVGPVIKKQSPGPILFKQERIGKNGKRFTMYKIRSMHMDAEERKKEFLAQNRVKDGMMFKLDFDPRIIGNRILPDGTQKTGIGDWIRRHSIDEWPQFFNVLKGTMSCVGTRPPTVDEWEKYEYHHRARMAIKPGITGLWQISGRSEITDFEKVVQLDTQYISEWSIGLDIKIVLKTIGALFSSKGAM